MITLWVPACAALCNYLPGNTALTARQVSAGVAPRIPYPIRTENYFERNLLHEAPGRRCALVMMRRLLGAAVARRNRSVAMLARGHAPFAHGALIIIL